MQNLVKSKLPQTVRSGLVGTTLDIKNPTAYFAKADELMASVRSKQMTVNEVTNREVGAVSHRKSVRQKQKEKDVCLNHERFKQQTWKCLQPKTCKYRDKVVPKPAPTKPKEQKEKE